MFDGVRNTPLWIAKIKPLFKKATKTNAQSFTAIFYVDFNFSNNRKIVSEQSLGVFDEI